MRNPLPAGAAYDPVTKELWITFDEPIVAATTPAGIIELEGVPVSKQNNFAPTTVAGRRVRWTVRPILGLNLPPARVSYNAATGAIVGKGDGHVQSFADFPLTLV